MNTPFPVSPGEGNNGCEAPVQVTVDSGSSESDVSRSGDLEQCAAVEARHYHQRGKDIAADLDKGVERNRGDDDSARQLVSNKRRMVDDAIALYRKKRQSEPYLEQKPQSRRPTSAMEIRTELNRIEGKIYKAARVELELLNKSKTIRSQRESMTRRYMRLCRLLDTLPNEDGDDEAGSFVPARLPPVMPQRVCDLTSSD
jgi:hypothetical protein